MTKEKWKKLLVWVSAYVGTVVFALVGGYFMLKDDDEKVKKTCKNALITYLVFLAIRAFLSIFSYVGGMFDRWYQSGAYDFYNIASALVSIAAIIVYASCAVYTVFRGGLNAPTAPAAPVEETETSATEEA